MVRSVLKRAGEWRPGRLARNTAHAGAWNLARAGLQALTLVLMARLFGPDAYGRLSGTVSLYATVAQIVGLGSGIALVRHLARDGLLAARFFATRALYAASGVALWLLSIPLSAVVLDGVLPPLAFALLSAAELVVAPLLLPSVYRFQAEERMRLSGALLTVAPLARFAAVAVAMALGIADITLFAGLYLGCLVVSVAAAMIATHAPAGNVRNVAVRNVAQDGLPFVIGSVAATAGSELDKTALLRLAGATVAGHYAAAYRIVSAATIPVASMILAVAPRMFRGDYGTRLRLPKPVLLATILYAIGAAGLLWLLAPLTHLVLGDDFRASEPILRALSILVLTGSMRQLINASLTTSDKQWARNAIELAALAATIGLLLLLVPGCGSTGAVMAMVAGDVIAIAAGYAALGYPARKPS